MATSPTPKRTIAVNDAYRVAPWADVLYGADHRWWDHHEYVREFRGERWTQNKGPIAWPDMALSNGLNVVTCRHQLKLSKWPQYIYSGWNSSFQAMNLAILFGAKRVLLLGVDLHPNRGAHFFGDHPPKLQRQSPWNTFRNAFENAAPQCKELGVEVINCSPDSALNCFPKMEVEDALCKRATSQ